MEFSHAYCTLVLDHRWQLSLCDKAHVKRRYSFRDEKRLQEAGSRLDIFLGSWEDSKWAQTLQKRIVRATELHARVTARGHSAMKGTSEGFDTSGPQQSQLLHLGQDVFARVLQCMDAKAVVATSATCKTLSALVKAELRPEPDAALATARKALVAAMCKSKQNGDEDNAWLGVDHESFRIATVQDSSAVHLDGSRPMVTTLGVGTQAREMVRRCRLLLPASVSSVTAMVMRTVVVMIVLLLVMIGIVTMLLIVEVVEEGRQCCSAVN